MPIQESHSATLDRLESELNSVLEQDNRYWTENDAKFRAVAQNVSYEQFEEIVKASHLKPLEKKDKSQLSSPKNAIWNSISNDTRPNTLNTEVQNRNKSPKATDDPKNVSEFYACWQTKDLCDKISILKKTKLQEILTTEVPPELFVDIVHTLNHFEDSEIDVIVRTLEVLSETKRFSLTLEFLSKTEKETVAELMARLADTRQNLEELGVTERRIENIAKRFKVH